MRAGVKSHDVQLTKRGFHVLSTPTSSARGWSRQKVEIELLNVWPVVICDGRVWPGVVCYGWIGMRAHSSLGAQMRATHMFLELSPFTNTRYRRASGKCFG